MNIYIATEDELSEAVTERVIATSSKEWTICVKLRKNGNGYLKKKLPELTKTAHKVHVFLLTDLDKSQCASALITEWTDRRELPAKLYFRVAVKEIEAWLLGDVEGISNFLQIPSRHFPSNPETVADPKQFLLNLVRKYGTRTHKSELLPIPHAKARIGLGYNALLTTFVRTGWDPCRAASRCDSLARAMRCLEHQH